jgi:hypothetical protein
MIIRRGLERREEREWPTLEGHGDYLRCRKKEGSPKSHGQEREGEVKF